MAEVLLVVVVSRGSFVQKCSLVGNPVYSERDAD